MSLLDKYITIEMFRYFAIILAAVIGIYLTVDFIEKVDDFIEAGVPVTRACVYLIYKTPFIIAQITPVGVLICVLVTFGLMSKHNELIALASSGVSNTVLLAPTLKFALLIALGLICISEFFAPLATLQADHIWLSEVKKENVSRARQQDIWIKRGKTILNMQYYHKKTNTAQGICLNRFNSRFALEYRLDADSAEYSQGQWHLKKAVEQRLVSRGKGYTVTLFEDLTHDLPITPSDLNEVTRRPSQMGFNELCSYIKDIEADGYDATIAKVDLHAKAAYPFTCLIMGLIGLAVAVRGKVRDGMVAGIMYGIGIIFIYWIFYSFCLSLGYGNVLPPVVATWLANFLFTCFGWMLYAYAQ